MAIVIGTNNSETLNGTNGDDYFLALAGDDTLNASEGNDILLGGFGNDWANYSAYGINGIVVDLIANTAIKSNSSLDVLLGIENISGTAYSDSITGDGDNNEIHGNDGDDFMIGWSGNDIIYAGDGNDTAYSLTIEGTVDVGYDIFYGV